MQHDPDPIGFIQTNLDEVIAGSERSQVLVVVRLRNGRVLLRDQMELGFHAKPVPWLKSQI